MVVITSQLFTLFLFHLIIIFIFFFVYCNGNFSLFLVKKRKKKKNKVLKRKLKLLFYIKYKNISLTKPENKTYIDKGIKYDTYNYNYIQWTNTTRKLFLSVLKKKHKNKI